MLALGRGSDGLKQGRRGSGGCASAQQREHRRDPRDQYGIHIGPDAQLELAAASYFDAGSDDGPLGSAVHGNLVCSGRDPERTSQRQSADQPLIQDHPCSRRAQ